MRAAAVVAEGRRAEQAAAAIVALAWAAPAWTFGWAGCEALGLSSAWALVPAVLVAAGVLRGRRFDERACVARLEAALATEGALELALESERGRDLPARSAAAVHARVEERADATTVRGVALAGAPRSALVGLAVATFGLIALGVVRNVKVMTRGPAADAGAIARGPAAAELTPAERREMQRHPTVGAERLGAHPQLAQVVQYVEEHHERWDGLGYPRRLRGREISRPPSRCGYPRPSQRSWCSAT